MFLRRDVGTRDRGVLAVGAHWDDIELGCGLTLMRLKKEFPKWELYGMVLTKSNYKMGDFERTTNEAISEGMEAFGRIGITWELTLTSDTQYLVYSPSLMQEIEGYVTDDRISMAFIPWLGDMNTDHQAAFRLARVACRNVPSVLCYQSNGYYDVQCPFVPQVFVGFTAEEYTQKRELMKIHASEYKLRAERWQREIVERDRYWGSLCGADYAEGFVISRLRL